MVYKDSASNPGKRSVLLISFAVACGGAVGALLRVLVQQFFVAEAGSMAHLALELPLIKSSLVPPWGTLVVNIIGSAVLGYVLARQAAIVATQGSLTLRQEARFLFASSGLASSLTTFSALSYQVVALWQQGAFVGGIAIPGVVAVSLYLLIMLGLSLIAVMLAFAFTRAPSASGSSSE